MRRAFLVFDAGTGAGRSLVVNDQGEILGTAYKEWGYQEIPDAPEGLELDARHFLRILLQAGAQAIKASGLAPANIKAIAVTGQREGVVFLNGRGHVVYAGPNFDGRAQREGKELAEKHGREIYFTAGTYPPTYGLPARLAWFQRHSPEVYDQINATLTLGDWLAFALTGEKVSEPSLAASTGILDIRERGWSHELTELHQIPSRWLPRIVDSGVPAGTLLPKIAEQLGLEGIPVAVAGGDTQCAMLGMGLTKSGETGCIAGTTSPVQRITSEPVFDARMRTYTSCYVLPRAWILESNAVVTGLALRWVKESLGMGYGYDQLNALAESVPAGSRGTLAFLGEEILDLPRYMPSTIGGFLFPAPAAQIGMPEYYRATLESNAYAVRGNIEQINEITKKAAKRIHVCGGQTSSKLFNRILSNVTRLPLEIHSKQATAIGAAVSAAVAAGAYASLEEASKQMRPQPTGVEPDNEISSQYEQYYQKWLIAYHSIHNLSERYEGGSSNA